MKIADLKRSFTPVLDMMIQFSQGQGGSLNWRRQYNLSCEQDLFQAKEELLLPFLKNLRCTFTDSQTPSKHDSDRHRIRKNRKRRYLGRYFAHPMMQNRRAKRDDYKSSAVRVTQRYVP
ncbi:hypothetical protein [Piscirickettsia salmonis]|uniref:hypothetical protein n=1 Tax=Piscirickettsia salmonis TaxID=1238 RepID=UPI0012BB1125|nr:hypothetical protein [Piscirickettsia salmonis]QGP58041.1 hypothetical protein PsalBI1_00595 [Piscirickettsia salmonis]